MRNKIFFYSDTVNKIFNNENLVKEEMWSIVICPICSSSRKYYLFKKHFFTYYRCRKCDFVYSNPRLKEKALNVWYSSNYYNAAIRSEQFLSESKNDPFFTTSLPGEYITRLCKTISELSDIDAPIIDIGCGSGAVLYSMMKKHGYRNVFGIDCNRGAVNYAKTKRGIPSECCDLHVLVRKNAGRKYGIAICTEVIEHIHDLHGFINDIKKIISINGILAITTPSNDNMATKLGGVHGDHYMAPNHVNFFNKKNLSIFLKQNGFKILECYQWKQKYNLRLLLNRLRYDVDWAATNPPFIIDNKILIPKMHLKQKKQYVRKLEIKENKASSLSSETYIDRNFWKKFLRIFLNSFQFEANVHMMVIAKKMG